LGEQPGEQLAYLQIPHEELLLPQLGPDMFILERQLGPPQAESMSGKEIKTDLSHDKSIAHIENETQTFLRVAEIVLADTLVPLRAQEIVDRAIERGLFGDHVLGRTPEKSMQARLSMDILRGPEKSSFMRVARGRFTLRRKVFPSLESKESVGEYIAQRRILRTPKEEVLCVSERAFSSVLTFQGIDTDAGQILSRLLEDQNLVHISRAEAETRNDAKQFITYVLVQCGQRLLFFKRSYLSRAAEFLRGAKCIGFGGHVSAADADMLSRRDSGISSCARRELSEELHLTDADASNFRTVRLFQNVSLERLGILNDDSSEVGRRHIAVIFRAWLPEWAVARQLEKGDSSIKGLGWIDLAKDNVNITEFEYWSQLCLRKFYPSTPVARSSFRLIRNSKLSDARVIAIAGRIGSGKTETANYFAQRLDRPVVKSGDVLRKLMGAPPISEIGRREFQARALNFITDQGGPSRLADAIARAIEVHCRSSCFVDGLRHLATYEALETALKQPVGLIFIQTPPDVAYDMFRAREAEASLSFSYREFLEFYDAPVEAELQSLGRNAQAYIFNSFGIDAFRRTLDEVAELLRSSGVTGLEKVRLTS
jgi:predicted NUDIX family phosphoesterase